MSIKTITSVPPIDFLSVGQPLSAWSISGNSQQNGTPAPDAPIYPEFVGDKTENLFDISTAEDTEYYINYADYLVIGADGDRFIAQKVSVTPLTAYTFSWGDTTVGTDGNSPYIRVCEYANTQFLSKVAYKCIDYVNKTFTIITSQDTTVLDIRYDSNTSTRKQTITNLMLNTGSTAKPYEPYGYKLPITISEQTTPVYLGQTQMTRRIKKLVLTGEEPWTLQNDGTATAYLSAVDVADPAVQMQLVCTHYQAGEVYSSNTDTGILVLANGGLRIREENAASSDRNAFIAFLQQQYANGTPVIIWYVMAESETGIVNEPLAKIGSYVDTVASTNTGAPSIPTSEGDNTLSIGTTPQPSEVSITYMAPNTIAENLQRLQIARTNIATAITTKGGTLIENAGFEDFPDAINNIPSESSGMPMAGITILLYDGSTFGDAGPTTIIEEGSI